MKWKVQYKIKGENKVRTEIVDLSYRSKVWAGVSWKAMKEKENLDKYEFINATPMRNATGVT